MKKVIVILLALCIVLSSSVVFADDATNVITDIAFLRPIGFGAFVLGSALFVVALPISLITQSTESTAKVLVEDPFEYTFVRPVGEVGSNL